MNSLILRTTSRVLMAVLLVVSVIVLLRGHNEPGGGFIGGLLTAGGLAIYGLAHGAASMRRLMRVDPRTVIASGLVVALVAAVSAPLAGEPLLTGLWAPFTVPLIGKLSTVLLFDVGVHLVVVGSVLQILLALGEER
ncbi:MAG: Na+/H+ antiporter subunit B [Planctomycetota bacterium]